MKPEQIRAGWSYRNGNCVRRVVDICRKEFMPGWTSETVEVEVVAGRAPYVGGGIDRYQVEADAGEASSIGTAPTMEMAACLASIADEGEALLVDAAGNLLCGECDGLGCVSGEPCGECRGEGRVAFVWVNDYHVHAKVRGKVIAQWWPSQGKTMIGQRRGRRCPSAGEFVKLAEEVARG